MTKEELMARAAEAAIVEKAELESTLIVDVHCRVKRDYVNTVSNALMAELAGFKAIKYTVDMVNPFTPASKFRAALTAVRLSKAYKVVLIITNDFINVTDWVKTYKAKDSAVFVHIVGESVVYTSDEYLCEIGQEMILDTILRARHCVDRTILEDFAEAFGDAVGWSFSGPIRERQLTPEAFDSFKSYETLPYAGKEAYYYKDQLMEASVPSGKTTVTPTLKSRLLVTQGVPVDELIAFRDFLIAAHEMGINSFLEPNWTICKTCGHPVRQSGETYDDGYCLYCDTPIPDFVATIYDEDAYDRYYVKSNPDEWEHYTLVESSDDEEFWQIVVDDEDIKKYQLTPMQVAGFLRLAE